MEQDWKRLLERLYRHYEWANRVKFGGALPAAELRINFRLRALTGRVFYDARLIEFSSFHVGGEDGLAVAVETLEHEMLHLYLDVKGLPSGHTPTFKKLADTLGIAVWHRRSYPRNRAAPAEHVYECPACSHQVVRSRRLSEVRRSACGECCRRHGDGSFDERFVMRFVQSRWASRAA